MLYQPASVVLCYFTDYHRTGKNAHLYIFISAFFGGHKNVEIKFSAHGAFLE